MAAAIKPARIPTGDVKVDKALDEIRNRLSELADTFNQLAAVAFSPVKAGGFVTGATGALVGTGAAVIRASAGTYTITLDVGIPNADGGVFVQEIAAGVGTSHVLENESDSVKTLRIYNSNTFAPADRDFVFVALKWRNA